MTLVVTATATEAAQQSPKKSPGDVAASYQFTVNFINPCDSVDVLTAAATIEENDLFYSGVFNVEIYSET